MKLAILSRNSKLYSTRRLVEAARERGHSVRVLDPLRCYMRIASDGFDMHYKGKPIAGYDAVIPRIGASITRYGTAVLRQFELMGSYTPNPSDAILRARDKLRCHQLLAAQGIGLPTTVFGDNPDDTVDLLSMLGPPPHVIKLNEGTQGAGVMLTEKPSASRSVIEALRGLYANFLVQEFIARSRRAPTCAASWSATRSSRRCGGRRRRAISAPTCIAAARPRRSRPSAAEKDVAVRARARCSGWASPAWT